MIAIKLDGKNLAELNALSSKLRRQSAAGIQTCEQYSDCGTKKVFEQ